MWWYPGEWAGVVVSVGVGWCGGIRREGWCCGIRRVGLVLWYPESRLVLWYPESWLVWRYPWELFRVVVSMSLGWCGGI